MEQVTKHDIRRSYRDIHDILIPAGTPAKWIEGGAGGWAVEPRSVQLLSKTGALFKHDSTHFYIWVGAADLEPKDVVEASPPRP
jgi:hypothetical protein